MLTSPSSALIDSSRTGYRSCTRRRPSLQQQGPPSTPQGSGKHGAAVRDDAPPTAAGAAFPAAAGLFRPFAVSGSFPHVRGASTRHRDYYQTRRNGRRRDTPRSVGKRSGARRLGRPRRRRVGPSPHSHHQVSPRDDVDLERPPPGRPVSHQRLRPAVHRGRRHERLPPRGVARPRAGRPHDHLPPSASETCSTRTCGATRAS